MHIYFLINYLYFNKKDIEYFDMNTSFYIGIKEVKRSNMQLPYLFNFINANIYYFIFLEVRPNWIGIFVHTFTSIIRIGIFIHICIMNFKNLFYYMLFLSMDLKNRC